MRIKNLILKILNKKKYKERKNLDLYNNLYKKIIETIIQNVQNNKKLNFFHSGHVGDIITSLAVIKKLSLTHECNLFINLNKKISYDYNNHPGNGFFMNQKLFNNLEPLLKCQKYLKTIKIYDNENIHVNLDHFRALPVKLINPPRYYFHLLGEKADLSKPFIDVTGHEKIKNKIVVIRSFRFRNEFISYRFLKDYDNILFIGLKSEYEDFIKYVPNAEFYDCKNFLEMAQIIKSSKFFIGNQSLGYAIADGLNIPRILENCPDYSAVQPEGEQAYDFFYQPHFEKWFNFLLNKK